MKFKEYRFKLYKKKNKRGAILADAFIALTIAAALSMTIAGFLFLSDKLTDNQLQRIEAYNIATTYLEQMQSSDVSARSSNNDAEGVLKIPVNGALKPGGGANDHWVSMETNVRGNNIDYKVSVKIEEDTTNTNLNLIRVVVSWYTDSGELSSIEHVGFKVVDL